MPRIRTVATPLFAAIAVLLSAGPAGAKEFAPQPVDTTEQGAFGFVLMALMCGLIVGALFFMDKVRQRKSGTD